MQDKYLFWVHERVRRRRSGANRLAPGPVPGAVGDADGRKCDRVPLRLLPHESLSFLAAFLIAAGCLLAGGLGPREGRSIEVGLLVLVAAGVVALSASQARRDRLAVLGVAVGAAALLVIAFEIRDAAPGA